ncbi:MAG: threonine--tRNA ligase [Candidatus Azambacteria bacterium]|nr:threonine--tRNA ligase [Candidatus Azambacteria bacterium]
MKKTAKILSHQELGTRLDLYSFNEISPGAPFWHPKGMVIFRELEKLIREALDKQNYQEISTPIMVRKDLFEKSGHFQFYKELMFTLKVDNQTFVLKPMNCPESTIIYSSKIRSWRDLPLRFSEIGRLHRKELSGVLSGLFRVRQITMDDAHIYVRIDELVEEINRLIALISSFYKIFNFKTSYFLATRPDKAIGDKKFWILVENYQGAFPLWLSPIQAKILPIGSRHEKYAKKVCAELAKNNIRVEINNANETMGKKIREAELEKVPYILVVGDKEEKNSSVAVRKRSQGDLGGQKLSAFLQKIKKEIEDKK